MKKAIQTIVLFSMVLVLTSFTTPTNFATSVKNYIPKVQTNKDSGVVAISPTVWTPKSDFFENPHYQNSYIDLEPGSTSPTTKVQKID